MGKKNQRPGGRYRGRNNANQNGRGGNRPGGPRGGGPRRRTPYSDQRRDYEPADSGDFLLCRTRRYAHALDYVLRLAATHGFEVALLEAAVLREEGGVDVAGGVVVLRRGG